MKEKGKKYRERNWEKGQPLSRFLDSALRHLFQVLDGKNDEDHLVSAAWNIMAAVDTRERIKEGLLPTELMDLKEQHFIPPLALFEICHLRQLYSSGVVSLGYLKERYRDRCNHYFMCDEVMTKYCMTKCPMNKGTHIGERVKKEPKIPFPEPDSCLIVSREALQDRIKRVCPEYSAACCDYVSGKACIEHFISKGEEK